MHSTGVPFREGEHCDQEELTFYLYAYNVAKIEAWRLVYGIASIQNAAVRLHACNLALQNDP